MITLREIQEDLKSQDLGTYLALEFISEIAIMREDEGISQKELSKISGVAQKTISRIESGKDVPTLETIGKLIQALGYTPKITFEKNQF